MRARGVEIAEKRGVPVRSIFPGFCSIVALCLDMIGDDILVGGLGTAVRICRADWTMFGDWDHVWKTGCVAVDSGGRGEDNVGHIVLGHAAQQAYCAVDIGAIVFERDFT